MTIVLTGGGSGGHITPILAVARELKKLRPDVRLVYVGQKGDGLSDVPRREPAIDQVCSVRAGKFRRYQGEGWRQLFDIKTQVQNVRDGLYVLVGIWQSYWLLRRLRPSAIFTRGGYVSVPVAVAGHLLGVPYITHDSDSTPSLANRIIARWATKHAVALPADLYPYPRSKTITVGVPVSDTFSSVDTKLQQSYKNDVGLGQFKRVLLVTGGGNGAESLNNIAGAAAAQLLVRDPDLGVVHLAGRTLLHATEAMYDGALKPSDRRRVTVLGFTDELYKYSGAADVIIARGGASSLAEFAIQGKACVIIPARQLSWQVHHAKTLAKHHAIVELDEVAARQPNVLYDALKELLDNSGKRQELAHNLAALAHPDAAKQLAVLLLDQAPAAS